MATRDAAKRKHPANGGKQESSKPGPNNKPKDKRAAIVRNNGNGRRRKKIDDEEEEEGGDEEGEDEIEAGGEEGKGEGEDVTDDDDDDYNDARSQKRRMMQFEKQLKAMKKQKKSIPESSAKFKEKVKLQEKALINSLKEERMEIKRGASSFSKTLNNLLQDAFSISCPEPLTGPIAGLPGLQRNSLHSPQASIAALSTKFLASTKSLQTTLTTIVDHDLVLGEGWGRDGDLSISAIREAHQAALVELMEMISKDDGESITGKKEDAEEVAWRNTVKKSTKGISRLLQKLPIPIADSAS